MQISPANLTELSIKRTFYVLKCHYYHKIDHSKVHTII